MTAAPLIWPGETVVCLGSGPSLTQEDVDYVRGKARVIVVNSTYRLAPWADVLYACDDSWWGRASRDRSLETFGGLRFSITYRKYRLDDDRAITIEPHKAKARVSVLRNTGEEGLETSPLGLRTGQNSGYQAVNLAVHLGARRIVLLGYDMQYGPRNAKHWSGHPADALTSPFQLFVRLFESLVEPIRVAGVEIVNCSRRTALQCFPKRELREVLA